MAGEGRSTSRGGGSDWCDGPGGITALWVLMDRCVPEALLLAGDGCRLGIPDDAVGFEITPISDQARVDSHRWRLWAEVDRRPFLAIGGSPDAPHRDECSCRRCGGELFGCGQHLDSCLCWRCVPDRWGGRRYGRLLGHLRRKREIFDAQSSPFGIWEMLPFVARVGLDWLAAPPCWTVESAEEGEPA